jgi:hypothetical protein
VYCCGCAGVCRGRCDGVFGDARGRWNGIGRLGSWRFRCLLGILFYLVRFVRDCCEVSNAREARIDKRRISCTYVDIKTVYALLPNSSSTQDTHLPIHSALYPFIIQSLPVHSNHSFPLSINHSLPHTPPSQPPHVYRDKHENRHNSPQPRSLCVQTRIGAAVT